MERAIEARRALVERDLPPLEHGDHLRWLSRLLWWSGRGEESTEAGDRAIAVLEAFPGSRELAMALSARSQLAMLAHEHALAIELGERALAMTDDEEIAIHALTNVASAVINEDLERGRAGLEEAHARAVAAGMADHAARALVNLVTGTLARNRADPRVPADLERALAFARAQELDGYTQYMLGMRAVSRLLGGAWALAEADARAALELGNQPGVSLCPTHIVLGHLQSRRGEPEAADTLEAAWQLAVKTGEIQRLAPAAAAKAEYAWLRGELERELPRLRESHALADERGDAWGRAELAFWLRRAGVPTPTHADDPPPFARAAAGDWAGAAAIWLQSGLRYEAADALVEAGQALEALAILDELGATFVAQRLRRALRAAGVRRIPRGPRPASRATPGGLTPRESEVLAQLERGATNAEIAAALVISPKTVDHHVSAVLGKLGATSRRELLKRT
jgi:DNA-binding CsgD family transcriptional regulator